MFTTQVLLSMVHEFRSLRVRERGPFPLLSMVHEFRSLLGGPYSVVHEFRSLLLGGGPRVPFPLLVVH